MISQNVRKRLQKCCVNRSIALLWFLLALFTFVCFYIDLQLGEQIKPLETTNLAYFYYFFSSITAVIFNSMR